MANSLDSVTAATKLRKEMADVKLALREKRKEYRRRMEQVKEREEKLKVDRADLQEKLIQFYKFIQDNELKRNKATKKAAMEEKAKQERHTTICELMERAKEQEQLKYQTRERYHRYVKYEKYLTDVLQHGDNEEYQDAHGIIARWQTLEDNKRMLQKRKNDLESELEKRKTSLSMKRQRKKNDAVDLQIQLAELQNKLEQYQKSYKRKYEDLEKSIGDKSKTTTVIGQVRMACQNLHDKCVAENNIYKARSASTAEQAEMNQYEKEAQVITSQLTVICDCLLDYQEVINRHKQKSKAGAADGKTGGGGAGFTAKAPSPPKKPKDGAKPDLKAATK